MNSSYFREAVEFNSSIFYQREMDRRPELRRISNRSVRHSIVEQIARRFSLEDVEIPSEEVGSAKHRSSR